MSKTISALKSAQEKKTYPQMVHFSRKTIFAGTFTRKIIVLLFHTISPADKLRINHEVPTKHSPFRQPFCQKIPIGKSITSDGRIPLGVVEKKRKKSRRQVRKFEKPSQSLFVPSLQDFFANCYRGKRRENVNKYINWSRNSR